VAFFGGEGRDWIRYLIYGWMGGDIEVSLLYTNGIL
jgi:hypothetical protein